jgi:hypothetical protein
VGAGVGAGAGAGSGCRSGSGSGSRKREQEWEGGCEIPEGQERSQVLMTTRSIHPVPEGGTIRTRNK